MGAYKHTRTHTHTHTHTYTLVTEPVSYLALNQAMTSEKTEEESFYDIEGTHVEVSTSKNEAYGKFEAPSTDEDPQGIHISMEHCF